MYFSLASLIGLCILCLILYLAFRKPISRIGEATSTAIEGVAELTEVGITAATQLAAHNADKLQLSLQEEQAELIARYSRLPSKMTPIQFHRAITRHQAELVSDKNGNVLSKREQDIILRQELMTLMDNMRAEVPPQSESQPQTATTVKARGNVTRVTLPKVEINS